VILALGVRPEATLAQAAGLAIGARGGIVVDDRMRTSDPRIYAVGDAIEVRDVVIGLGLLGTGRTLGATGRLRGLVQRAECAHEFFDCGTGPRFAAADPDPLGRACIDERRRRHPGRGVAIVVETSLRFAPQHASRQALRRRRRRPESRLLVELVVDRFHNRMRNIEPGEVEQFERPHAKARRTLKDAVDGRVFRDAFAGDAQRFSAIASAGVIDDESRRVLGSNGGVT